MNKDVAAFSYVWIMSIVVYASRKDSRFTQFHSKQGVVLFLASIPVWLIPGIGHVLEMLVVAGMLLGFIHAAQGQYADVPVAGPLSRGEWSMRDVSGFLKKGWEQLSSVLGQIFHAAGKHAGKKPGPSNTGERPVDNPPVTPVP